MPLTALQHQKAAALQEISTLARPGGMANVAMMKSLVNRMLPLISQWERSDPDFARLGMLLRQARVKPTPNTLATVSAQAQRMVSKLRNKLPSRTNRAGEKQVWDPGRGHVTSPMFEEGEPVRTFSPMGWRGSKKYPFGKAFPEKNLIEGLSGVRRPGFLAGLGNALVEIQCENPPSCWAHVCPPGKMAQGQDCDCICTKSTCPAKTFLATLLCDQGSHCVSGKWRCTGSGGLPISHAFSRISELPTEYLLGAAVIAAIFLLI